MMEGTAIRGPVPATGFAWPFRFCPDRILQVRTFQHVRNGPDGLHTHEIDLTAHATIRG
jgi:hypothetical protein